MEIVYIVVGAGPIVLGVYRHEHHADMHKRTVTGAQVVPATVRERLASEVLDQLGEDFDDDPTPVTEPFKK